MFFCTHLLGGDVITKKCDGHHFLATVFGAWEPDSQPQSRLQSRPVFKFLARFVVVSMYLFRCHRSSPNSP
jgi:hypothetical protein